MSEDNLNISQLRQDYPFLNNTWDLYDSFDKPVEGAYKVVYEAICKLITANLGADEEKYYPFCLQLIRNLDPECKNKNIFQNSGSLAQTVRNYACYYHSYDEIYEEPINIIRLRIFDDNMEIIKNTLMMKGELNYNHCQEYVCECVNIYNKLNRTYCSGPSAQPHKHQKTCDMLKTLKQSYNMFLFDNSEIRSKIPSLEAIDDDLLAKCPSIQSQHSLQAVADDHSGSSTSKIPATIGTMAGVSSVFALLYKLTPAGRWINTGLRGSGGTINNSLYINGQDELLLDGIDHNNFNSYNIGYEPA